MKNKQKRFDSHIGEEYDLFSLALPHHDYIQDTVAKSLQENISEKSAEFRVLEIGCGTGITSKKILEADARTTLLCVDNVEEMINKTNAALSGFASNRYTLEVADALTYLQSTPDSSVNAVASVWTLHNLKKAHRFAILKEIHRVLKVGGVFINADKIASNDPKLHADHLAWQMEQFDVFETIGKPELKIEWTHHYNEDEKADIILREANFMEDLYSIGFSSYQTIFRAYMDAIVVAKKQ